MTRPRKPQEELKVEWSKREGDHIAHYPDKQTGGFILHFLFGERLGTAPASDAEIMGQKKLFPTNRNPNIWVVKEKGLWQELEERGYDPKTLKLSVRKKQPKP